jgi:short-subunit dehydrogenase
MRMTRAVLPHMGEQASGRIINVSSVPGLVSAPFMALYAATKHAIEGYAESREHEVREHGVRVLLAEPAYTRTSFDATPSRSMNRLGSTRDAAKPSTS